MTKYVFRCKSKVAEVVERFKTTHLSGTGRDAKTEQVSDGWWVVSDGPSPVSMHAGRERPPFAVGADMDIVLEIHAP